MPREADAARRPLIVDAHVHLGPCRVFDLDVQEQQLLDALERRDVDAMIVQPFPGAPDPRSVHDRIAALGQERPGRVFGIASISPHIGPDEYRAEVRRCVEELGFVGVKLHTIGHAVNPQHRDGRLVFDTAAELGVPIMVHTGTGAPFAAPSMVLPLTRDYPELPIVLAHAGYAMYTPEAISAARMADNLYLETSWTTSLQLGGMIAALGAGRVMFGSDLLGNVATELAKYNSTITEWDALEQSLGRTAVDVFGLTVAARDEV